MDVEQVNLAGNAHQSPLLANWAQGDFVLQPQRFVYRSSGQPESSRVDPEMAATRPGLWQRIRSVLRRRIPWGWNKAQSEGFAYSEVAGLVVISQTCDILRDHKDRPYVEVCPLVKVEEEALSQIRAGHRPAYAFIPSLAEERLVADLDRVMVVEKLVVASWERQVGMSTDKERRNFASSLSRKRSRFAFPDEFCDLADSLTKYIKKKHDKNNPEGRALQALQEIRVNASPSWDHSEVDLFFWFIRRDSDVSFEGKDWSEFLDSWLSLLPQTPRFGQPLGQVTTLDRLTAADYINSDRLDLDHLSSRYR